MKNNQYAAMVDKFFIGVSSAGKPYFGVQLTTLDPEYGIRLDLTIPFGERSVMLDRLFNTIEIDPGQKRQTSELLKPLVIVTLGDELDPNSGTRPSVTNIEPTPINFSLGDSRSKK